MSKLTTKNEQAAMARSLANCARVGEEPHFIELGVRRAYTSLWIYMSLRNLKRFQLVGVDFAESAQKAWQRIFVRQPKKYLEFVLGTTSQAWESREWPELSWVFVDACHCRECATNDIIVWGNMIGTGGHIVVHDTTARRKHYEANFQHYEPDKKGTSTRRFGVYEAVQPGAAAGDFLRDHFKLVEEVEDKNGVQIWEKK